MHMRNLLLIPALLGFCAAAALADTAPKAAHANIMNAQGMQIGTAKLKAVKDGVQISVKVTGLSAGDHGIHIHTVGKCEGPAFTTAGGHFNPTSAHHGMNNTMDPHPHAGDLPNLKVAANGKGSATVVAKGVTLGRRREFALPRRRHLSRDPREGRRLDERSVRKLRRSRRLRRHLEVAQFSGPGFM